MTVRLFHIGFMFPGVPKMRDLEPVFSDLGDWVRYAQTGWLLSTHKPALDVFTTIIPHIDTRDCIVITHFDGNSFAARLPPWIWTWIRSKGHEVVTADDDPEFFSVLLPPSRSDSP